MPGDCDGRLLTLLLFAALENPLLDKNAFGRETAALDVGRLRNAKSTPRVAHHAQSGHFLTSTVQAVNRDHSENSGCGCGSRACVGSVQFVCVKNTARLLHEVSVCARVQSRSPQGIMRKMILIKCFERRGRRRVAVPIGCGDEQTTHQA